MDSDPGRVMVTGASGFIGQAMVRALCQAGVPVTAATRRPIEVPAGVTVAELGEIGPDTRWQTVLQGCDAVLHLAARAHQRSQPASSAYHDINTLGTLTLARQAAAAGVRRFVFVSSIKVNGEATPPGRPFTEADPASPSDDYARSKAEAEVGLNAVASATGMELTIVRPPLVYGAGVGANFLTLMRWLARGIPLPLGAIRDNRRSLIGSRNLVDLLSACLSHPAAANQVFLAADGHDLSTVDLLQRTAAAMGRTARLVPVPVSLLRAAAAVTGSGGAIQRLTESLQVDASKARRLLGWTPKVSVDEGLRDAVAGIRSGLT